VRWSLCREWQKIEKYFWIYKRGKKLLLYKNYDLIDNTDGFRIFLIGVGESGPKRDKF